MKMFLRAFVQTGLISISTILIFRQIKLMDHKIERYQTYQNYTRNQKVYVTNVTKDWVFYNVLNGELQSIKKFSCAPERFASLYYKVK